MAPDETTFAYLKDRDHAPQGADWDAAVAYWRTLPTDDGATFDKEVVLDAATITPHVTWGTNPAQVAPIAGVVPDPDAMADPGDREAAERALAYMGLDRRTAAARHHRRHGVPRELHQLAHRGLPRRRRRARGPLASRQGLRALAVPGSHRVKAQAEAEGLDKIFTAAGFEWREPGCSMCLAMNPDKLAVGERCASTSNRNFEGRQGRGGRTHLVSPAVAAATAVAGTLRHPGGPGLMEPVVVVDRAGPSRSTAPTSTPTRSSPRTGSSASSAPASAPGSSPSGATTATSC